MVFGLRSSGLWSVVFRSSVLGLRSAVLGLRSAVRDRRGSLYVASVLGMLVVGLVVAAAFVMWAAMTRAERRLRDEVRTERCRSRIQEVLAAWDAAGRPDLDDPAYGWTRPCPGRAACPEQAGRAPGLRYTVLPAGDRLFVWVWDDRGRPLCTGEALTAGRE